MRLRSVRPINKVQTATVAGALAAIVIWVLETYAHINMPEYVAAALTTIIMAAVAYVTPMLPGEMDTVPSDPLQAQHAEGVIEGRAQGHDVAERVG